MEKPRRKITVVVYEKEHFQLKEKVIQQRKIISVKIMTKLNLRAKQRSRAI